MVYQYYWYTCFRLSISVVVFYRITIVYLWQLAFSLSLCYVWKINPC